MIIPDLYTYDIRTLGIDEFEKIEDPRGEVNLEAKFNYTFEDLPFFILEPTDDIIAIKRRGYLKNPISYRYYVHDYTDYHFEGLYIPHKNDSFVFTIPYEYYSKAYIHKSFAVKDIEKKPAPLVFNIDRFGRLHVSQESLLSYIEVLEKKIDVKAKVFPAPLGCTLQNQLGLAKKYLEPELLLFQDIPEDIIDFYAEPKSYINNILHNSPKNYLEFSISGIVPYKDVFELANNPESLNGWIFPDGSYLIFNPGKFSHDYFLFWLADIPNEYIEYNFIKIHQITTDSKVYAVYKKENMTEKSLRTLRRFKRKFYIEDMLL